MVFAGDVGDMPGLGISGDKPVSLPRGAQARCAWRYDFVSFYVSPASADSSNTHVDLVPDPTSGATTAADSTASASPSEPAVAVPTTPASPSDQAAAGSTTPASSSHSPAADSYTQTADSNSDAAVCVALQVRFSVFGRNPSALGHGAQAVRARCRFLQSTSSYTLPVSSKPPLLTAAASCF